MGLGLGLCCCGCPTCGGIFDDPTSVIIAPNFIDAYPSTSSQATHSVTAINFGLTYSATLSSGGVQVFSQTVGTGTNPSSFRGTLRLEDGATPLLSIIHDDPPIPGTPPAESADYVGDIGSKPGALFSCGADGWTLLDYRNPTTLTRYYQLMATDGCALVSTVGLSPTGVQIGTPDSWCCPNGNLNALGGPVGCVERNTMPGSVSLTVEDFTDSLPDWPWAQLNGVISLSQISEVATAAKVTAAYQSSTLSSGGCNWRWNATIVVPAVGGTLTSQCAALVSLTNLSGAGCTGAGAPFYGLSPTTIIWEWMQLGCVFGQITGVAASSSPIPLGGPTSLTWAAP